MTRWEAFRRYLLGQHEFGVGYERSSEAERYAVQGQRNRERLYAWELRFGLVKLEPWMGSDA